MLNAMIGREKSRHRGTKFDPRYDKKNLLDCTGRIIDVGFEGMENFQNTRVRDGDPIPTRPCPIIYYHYSLIFI